MSKCRYLTCSWIKTIIHTSVLLKLIYRFKVIPIKIPTGIIFFLRKKNKNYPTLYLVKKESKQLRKTNVKRRVKEK